MQFPYAQVRIYADESIEQVAYALSEKLFGGVAFGGGDIGLFEEVPSLRLQGHFLGLFVALHGSNGEYVLLICPAPKSIRGLKGTDAVISDYVAELVRSIGRWRVEVPKV
jgi:hypothetical protein